MAEELNGRTVAVLVANEGIEQVEMTDTVVRHQHRYGAAVQFLCH